MNAALSTTRTPDVGWLRMGRLSAWGRGKQLLHRRTRRRCGPAARLGGLQIQGRGRGISLRWCSAA